jgi:hypothetical protein
MATPRKAIVMEVYNDLVKEDLLDDRREYCRMDLHASYPELNSAETALLYVLIQNNFEPSTGRYEWDSTKGRYKWNREAPLDQTPVYHNDKLVGPLVTPKGYAK